MTPKSWEKRPDETPKAWEAFQVFLSLGAERGYTATGKRLKKQAQTIFIWSRKYDWKNRADEYDLHLGRIRDNAKQQAIEKVIGKAVEKYELSTQRTLLEVARLGYSDIRKAVTWDSEGNVNFVPSDQLDDHTAAAISSFEVKYDKNGNPTKSLKFHNKLGALNLAGQKDGLWAAPKSEGNITNNYLTLIQMLKSESVDAALTKLPETIVLNGNHQSEPD